MSSFNDEYLKLRKKRLEEEQRKKSSNSFEFTSGPYQNATKTEYDIGPVQTAKTTVKDNTSDTGSNSWFQKGAFEDGYQFGDVSKTILGTNQDIVDNVSIAVVDATENLIDTAAYGVGVIGGMFSDDFQDGVGDFIAKDLLKSETTGKVLHRVLDPSALLVDLILQGDTEGNSVLGEKADGLVQSGSHLVGSLALQTVGVPAWLTMGVNAFGSEIETAYQNDATHLEAGISGAITAGAEILFEKFSGGIKILKGTTVDDAAVKWLSQNVSNKVVRTLAKFGMDMVGEGAEEVATGAVSAVGRKLTYADEQEWQELFSSEDAWDSFVGGVVMGGVAGGGKIAISNSKGRDYTTGLTANEETVLNKIYNDRITEAEQDGTKLTNKQKNELYEQIQEELRKGYISTDDIESALGGETYNTYKSAYDRDTALKKEYNTLNEEYTELYKMKNGEKSDEQIDRQAELKNQLAELKQKIDNSDLSQIKDNLSKEVYDSLTRKVGKDGKNTRTDDFLIESYNERARRGTAFEADLSKYDDKTAETVKRAIDSGILNNTRRTHEFVDMVAKISADKGVLFDFTNNQKLKESGFEVEEGVTRNGFISKDGVTINVQSAKAINTVVGHEITHSFEKAKSYDKLQEAVFEYAKLKGEYDSRLASITKMYKKYAPDADPKAELTADLVGDYLFTDADFINNLSTKHRNVFQKIYDEIKYLLKVATAGSKEARELEKVKRAFDKAYRESGKTSGDTKYSLSDSDGKKLTKEQSEYFKDSKMRDENGNLKVMYHGSQDAGFHVFDANMSDDDTSFFFVDSNDVAASYSGTSETYEAQTIRTAEDMNNFIESIGVEGYEVVEKDGKFTLLYEGDRIADSNTAKGIYEEFCWYEGVGEGDANYKVYLNLTNPLVVDAKGRPWNKIDAEFSQEVYDKYQSLTAEEKAALTDLAEWEDFRIFNSEIQEARDNELASAYAKMGEDCNIYDLFSVAADNFSEDSLRENSRKYLKTRDYAQRAKEQGYDGVIFNNIHDNGGFSNGSEGASTVAIAFESNQIKSVANEKPTGNADIRYSLSESEQANNDVKVMDGGSVTKYSLSTWTPETQTKVRENLIKSGYEVDRVDKWIKDTNSVASVIAADKDRLDFVAADNQVMLKDNQEYIKTLDASTLCAKRLVYQGTFDAIQHRLPNTMLSSDDLIDLLNMMKEHGIQTPCGVCYVESRRRHLGKFAQGWLDSYNGEYKPNLDEVTTSDGLETLRKSHPQTYKDFVDAMNKKGSSNPKVVQLRTEYRNEIMSLTPKQIRDIESIGGLRVQSFSDFETPHLLDMMQAVMDMSAKGLHSQAYTKVPNFAWVFGDTGIKINLSLIAEGNGFDADGNLIFSSTEGMNIDEAMKLRDAYSQNVGTIIVGANDKHILACMADDRIDFIIPFHRSGWGMKELEMMGMSSYTDYTYGQKEHDLVTGKGVANLYPADYWDYTLSGKENAERYLNLCAKTGREPKFSKFLVNNGDGSYSLQPDGSTDGYWKTLIDFKMYDNEGNGAIQQKVQPNFNMEEAYRVLGEYEGGANKLPVANDVVEEFVAKYRSYQHLALAMSLSAEGETPKRYGNYNIFGEDIRLEAPTQEEVAPESEVVAKNAIPTENVAPMPSEPTLYELEQKQAELEDAIRVAMESNVPNAPKLINEYGELLATIEERKKEETAIERERLASLDDMEAPPEVEAPYYDENANTAPENPFEDRDIKAVGNRKVKAYMYENPEVKPFFQEEANRLLGELDRAEPAQSYYNGWLKHDMNYDAAQDIPEVYRVKRRASPSIVYLRDVVNLSYDEIRKGLNAIIEDNGAENIAAAKKIEFEINKRLMEGYVDDTGYDIPADQDYINLLNEKQIAEYSDEARAKFFEVADEYAPPADEDISPIAPVAENTTVNEPIEDAPIAEAYEAIKPKKETAEPRMKRVKEGEQSTGEIEPPKVAKILTEEPKVPKKMSRVLTQIRANILDKGSVFEDLSLKTGNRELQGKYNFMHYSEARAQKHIAEKLKPIVDKAEQLGKVEELYEYAYHLHNIDRMSLEANGGENKAVFGDTVTADVSREVVKRLEAENPEFKELSNEIIAYNAELRQMLVDAGVISQEIADLWAKMYPHYVPIRRLGDEGLSVNVPLDTNKTGINAPIKKATGGNRDILPLFDTMAMRTEQTFKAIAKNSFGAELMHTLNSTIESNETSLDDVIDSFDNHDELLQEGKNGKNPTFTIFENGKRVTFEITEDMYDALKPTGKGLSYTNKVANTASNIFRGLLTEYNPVFMTSNAIKDVQDVLINSQHAAKTYMNIPKAVQEMVTKGKWYTEYMRNGGEQNTYFDSQAHTFKTENKGFIKTIGMPLRAISEANNFIERVPRLAEYIASREAGRSVEVSMLDAARVTTNFGAGGDVTKFLNRNGATFLNASVQGFNQNVRNIREAKANGLKGWVTLAAKVTLAGLPALLLNNLLWDDDEEYEELSDYVKDNYYVIAKTKDGKFIRIPKGRTAAVIQDAFEQIYNAATGNDEVDLKNFCDLAISNLAPNNPLENNILAPIIQVANNKTWYGEDLVPSRLQDLPAAEQYDESTDSISKWLGEKLNYSPYKINYLLDQYSGGVGDVLLPMLTPEAESGDNSIGGNILAPMKDKFTTDSVLNNKNVSEFYDTMDELTVNAKSSKATDEDVLKYKYFNSVNTEIGELYAQKREIQNSDLPDDEKYEAVRELQMQINDLARESLSTYNNVYISDGYAAIGDTHYRWYEPGEDSDAEAGWQKITDKQLEKQEAVTSYLGVDPAEYWKNKTEYDFAYEYPEKYSVAKSVGGYSAYKRYTSELYDIKADKDEYGKSISGSRKEKVIEYVNNLDIDYGVRLILFKSEYNADDTYNYDIIDYLNSREDISYEEMETILKELGFIVQADGTILWD